MNIQEQNDKLKELQEEEKGLLNKYKDKHFDDEEKAKKYIQDNETELTRLNEIQKKLKM